MSQATHEFKGSVDFNQYELRNASFQNLITPPLDPVQGQLYFNSRLELRSPFYWNSNEWIPFGLKPIHKRYNDQASMLADQLYQISGYIYYRIDQDIYYEKEIGSTSSMSDYNPIGGSGTLTGYVPYTGATGNVDLGEKGISAGYVKYDTTPTSTPTTQGTTYWDVDDNTLAVIMNGTTLKVGEDQYYPVKNQTGVLIPKGTAVRFAGTLGASGRLLIAPFLADGSIPSSRFMGVTSEDIANGADGKVMWFGRIRGINTNAFNEGDVLYASTTVAGGFQTTVPEAPNNIVQVCAVINKSTTQGIIFVRPTLGSNINKDEGVKLTSLTDKDLLQYQASTGLFENVALSSLVGAGLSLDSLNQIQLGNDGAGVVDISGNEFQGGLFINASGGDGVTDFGKIFSVDLTANDYNSFIVAQSVDLVESTVVKKASTQIGVSDGVGNIDLEIQVSTDPLVGTYAIFRDQINSKGLEYAGDYESNFTARSLVTKQYVDGAISSGAYTHPSYTPITQTLSGATVLASFSSDSIGSVTGFTTRTLTPANIGAESAFSKGNIVQGNAIALTGTLTSRLVGSGDITIAHADTSSQANVSNTGGSVIQSISVDTYGHVTVLSSINLDTRYYTETEINTLLNNYQLLSEKGVANGYVPLDSSGKIPTAYIPDSILGQVTYVGTWNATTNSPTLPDPTTVKGDYYIVTVAGTYLGTDYQIGDWIISDGISWTKVDNSDSVTSVFGRTGNVVAIEADYQSFYPRLSQTYANPTWISSLAWSKITGTPTTLAGYGITDAVPSNRTLTINGIALDLTTNRSWSVGTVTSVGLSLPSIFTVTGSPVTTNGTLTATLASQTANTVFASPDGIAGSPTFRALSSADIPTLDILTKTTGTLSVARGGTGSTTLTGILIGNGTSAVTAVIGTASQLLRRNSANNAYEFFTHDFVNQAGARASVSLTTTGSSGAATYSSATGVFNIPNYTLTGLGGFANPMTTLGDIIYGATAGAPTRLPGNITTTKQFLSQTGTGAASAIPAWATITGSDIVGAALTKTDDTNVTLTLGGTPATSLLRAASLTLGWTGQLAVSRGGTGVSTLTGIVIGTGTTAMTAVVGTASQLLRRNAGNTAYEFFTHDFINQAGARTAISLTTTGTSGVATYNNTTGVFNIPNYTYTHPTYTALSPVLTGANVLFTFTTDATGHVTATTTRVLTPADIAAEPAFSKGSLIQGTGVSLSGTLTSRLVGTGDVTVSHSDTSTQASVVNTGGNIIQSVSVDDFGHVTSLGSMFGDDRWARRHVLIDSTSTWLYTSEAGTYPGIHVGQTTTGSSNFPSTLGGFAIFGGGQTNSVSYFARVFGFFRQYDSTNVYVGTANDNGANNGWALIYTSYNLTLSTLGGTPTTRTITINGTTQDLSADRTWNVGTVTSVALSAPVGFVVSGSPVTSTGTLSLAFDTGYSLPTTAKQAEWDTAYTNRITSLTTTGSSGAATLISNVLNIPTYTLAGLGGEPSITAGTTAQYWRGDKTWQILNTAAVPESGNLYYTDARARASISLTTTGNSGAATYSSATGVLNIPTYTLAGLGGFSNPMTTLGDIIYGGASGTPTRLAGNTTTVKQFLSQTGTGTISAIPSWSAITGADVTGAALTATNDTNVTLTLGGTPATALLRAASLTLGWAGTLAVGRGGSGASTLTGVLIGNGTSAFTGVAGTASQLLRRNAGNTAYEFFTHDFINQAGARSAISLTTTGTSGVATYSSATGVLNIPNYTYTHPTYTATNITATGAQVLSTFTSDVSGHVTGITTRALTPADIGAASTSHNHTLDSLSNVTITSNTNGEILRWNGTAWINNTLAEAGIQAAGSYSLTSAEITAVSLTTSTLTLTRAAGNLTASVPTWNQNTTGSAATLTTTRTIWGQNFNGSANVTGALSGATTIAMSGQLTNTVAIGTAPFVITSTTRVANLNVATAGTADTWTTARTLTIGSTGKSVNGSANVSWSLAEIGAAATSHTHSADDITSGILTAVRGGTGIGAYTAGNYIRALNSTTLEQRTPAQVISDLGISPSSFQRDKFIFSGTYSFTLTRTSPNAVMVFLNGQKLQFTDDWSISGNVVTVTTDLWTGAEISIEYFYSTPDVVPSGINGTGTINYITKWNTTTQLGVSLIQDDGSVVTLPAATDVLSAIAATVDTDKFMVLDGNRIKFRTGSEVLSDIGVRTAISLTTTGTSGLATYNSTTGVFNIPNYTYTHPAYTTRSITATGASVLSTFTSDALGHVTGITTRTLTAADIGAAASSHNQAASTITAGTFATGDFVFPGNLDINGQLSSPANAKGNSGTGTVTFNWNDGNVQTVTLNGNCTFALSNGKSGASYQIIVAQDGTVRTVTWSTTVKWPGGTAPTFTGTTGKFDIITISFDGTNYFGVISKNH